MARIINWSSAWENEASSPEKVRRKGRKRGVKVGGVTERKGTLREE